MDSAVVFSAASLDVLDGLRNRFAQDPVACLGDEEVVFDTDSAEVLEGLEFVVVDEILMFSL